MKGDLGNYDSRVGWALGLILLGIWFWDRLSYTLWQKLIDSSGGDGMQLVIGFSSAFGS